MPDGVVAGVVKSSPPKKGSAIPGGSSDVTALGKSESGLSTSGCGIHPMRSISNFPIVVGVGDGGGDTGLGGGTTPGLWTTMRTERNNGFSPGGEPEKPLKLRLMVWGLPGSNTLEWARKK